MNITYKMKDQGVLDIDDIAMRFEAWISLKDEDVVKSAIRYILK